MNQKILYQPTIEYYKYSFFFGKWKKKLVLPSTVVFDSWIDAEKYWSVYISGLIRRGIKLKEGNYRRYQSELIYNS